VVRHRPGDRVYLAYNAKLRGTVTKVTAKGFTVAYDSHHDERGKRVPGGRYSYPLNRMSVFLLGDPE
jgi:hypothetical protein